jgi:hypothetical protein
LTQELFFFLPVPVECGSELDERYERNFHAVFPFPPQQLRRSHPAASHRFHLGSTFQSAKNPSLPSGSSWKLAPMDRSGTMMIACLRPWFASLSSAMKISAQLFPEAGGRLDQQIRLAALPVGALLHGAHPEREFARIELLSCA